MCIRMLNIPRYHGLFLDLNDCILVLSGASLIDLVVFLTLDDAQRGFINAAIVVFLVWLFCHVTCDWRCNRCVCLCCYCGL